MNETKKTNNNKKSQNHRINLKCMEKPTLSSLKRQTFILRIY